MNELPGLGSILRSVDLETLRRFAAEPTRRKPYLLVEEQHLRAVAGRGSKGRPRLAGVRRAKDLSAADGVAIRARV